MIDRPSAYHTPDEISETTIVRNVVVSVSLLPHVSGALTDMVNSEVWDEIGVPVSDVLRELNNMIDQYYRPAFIGAILAFATAPPPGWLPLFGDILLDGEITYPELWSKIPDIWKDGSNIHLPDMGNRTLIGDKNFGTDLGVIGGDHVHTLTVGEMPGHTHNYLPPSFNPDVEGAGVPDIGATVLGTLQPTTSTGSGQPHNNMPPYLIVTWAIFAGRE